MWPIAWRCREPMMYGIDVDVVEMPGEIGLVTDGMLPETPLPDTLFAFGTPALTAI
jgi:hypothetical protein